MRSDGLYELLGALDRTPVDRQDPIPSLQAACLCRPVGHDEGHELSGRSGRLRVHAKEAAVGHPVLGKLEIAEGIVHRGDFHVIGIVGIERARLLEQLQDFSARRAEIQPGKGQSRPGRARPARLRQVDTDFADVLQRTPISTRLEVEPGAPKVRRDVLRHDPHGVVERRQCRVQPTERSIAEGEELIPVRFPHELGMGRFEHKVLAERTDRLALLTQRRVALAFAVVAPDLPVRAGKGLDRSIVGGERLLVALATLEQEARVVVGTGELLGRGGWIRKDALERLGSLAQRPWPTKPVPRKYQEVAFSGSSSMLRRLPAMTESQASALQ